MVRFAAAALALAVASLGLSARGAEILMLDFWSPHCGPCMQMKPTMHSLEQANYPIREVDTTRDTQLPRQFNVGSIPCFVMLVDGREVDREVGFTSSERLQQMFQKAKDVVAAQRGKVDATLPQDKLRFQNDDNAPQARGPVSNAPPSLPAQPGPPQDPWSRPGETKTRPVPVEQPSPIVEYPAKPDSANADFPPNLIAATVRIRVEDAQGNSFGTGTIIDSRKGEALIVTCGHLFRDSKGKGPMTVELFEVGPGGVQAVAKVTGQLISYDLDRDVAFVSIRPERPVGIAPVAPQRTAIQRGDRVATIGCSNGKDPTLLTQRITMLDRYQGPANIEVSGAPEEGRSGGGLFNLQGQLIGICYAADYEGKEGLYAALDSVHEELNRLGLKDVYAKSDAAAKPAEIAADAPLVRLQEPSDPIMPIGKIAPTAPPSGTPVTPVDGKTGPQNLNEAERAAWDEIMQRAATSEVVCIIRPKAPGGQSEVITLDNASPEFVRALEARQRASQAPVAR